MNIVARGILAGFSATIVLSLLMLLKTVMGIMPELDVPAMLGAMAGETMGVDGSSIGWMLHFVVGAVVFGLGFALTNRALPSNNQVVKGIVFGIAAWLVMMIAIMPFAGAGLFGMSIGLMAPMMTLILHIVFGAVLGLVFRHLR